MQQFILDGFAKAGLITDHGPIVAVNANASNPHYNPTEGATQPNSRGRFRAAGHVGQARRSRTRCITTSRGWDIAATEPPAEMQKVFGIVRDARDNAIARVKEAVRGERAAARIQVDDAARGLHREPGYGPSTSFIAPAIRSARRYTAPAPTWTIWRRTTSGGSCRGRAFRSSREFICRSSACARKWTCSSTRRARVTGEMQRELVII